MKTQERSAVRRAESLQVSSGAECTQILAVDDWDAYERLLMPHVVDGFVNSTWFESPKAAVVDFGYKNSLIRVL